LKERCLKLNIGLAALVILCTAALTCLLMQNRPLEAGTAQVFLAEAAKGPIEQFRTERQQLRALERSQLNEIIYSDKSDGEIVREGQRRLMELMDTESMETKLEGVLKARGFEGALATVSKQSVNILLPREALTQAETAVILELVLRETGITGGNVKIIPVN